MRRRELMLLLTGAMTGVPRAARAERRVMPVIGFLSAGTAPSSPNEPFLAAFRRGLSETGYVEGQNLVIEYRWGENKYDRLPALAVDLIDRKVDLIVALAAQGSVAAKNATSTIPIVFAFVSDPIGLGLVASLARPGGNVTGFSNIVSQLTPKRLELLCELVPQARVIVLLVNPNSPTTEPLIQDLQEAARAKGVQLAILKASTEREIDAAFATLVEMHADGLVVAGDPFILSRRDKLLALTSHHAVPAIYPIRAWAEGGGLISYGFSITAVMPQVGSYAGTILKGTKPADLPVQQPTTFELVINLKAAKALGLTIPQSILARADEVIE
jgi:putative ABC transport system substrate-binding protein